MAKRKSLNRRSGRFSRASVDSGLLNPDTGILDDDENPLWWKNLENTKTRRSTFFNVGEETDPVLDPASRVDSSGAKGEWWKMLETTDGQRTASRNSVQYEERVPDPKDSDADSSSDSESIKQRIQKRKVSLRAKSRESQSNAFATALNESTESIASNENVLIRRGGSNKNSGEQGNHSNSMDNIRKLKPKLFAKRKFSKSRNMFEDVLLEDESLDKQSLRKSNVGKEQEHNDINDSLIAGQTRSSLMHSSFTSNITESIYVRNPKAQSTLIDINISGRSSDNSLTEGNVQKQKPKWLKRNIVSAKSNNFSHLLESDENIEEEAPVAKNNDLVKAQSVPVESSSRKSTTLHTISNEKLPTPQKKRFRSRSLNLDDAADSDSGKSDDTSVSEPRINIAYKPKSKFLSNWKKDEELEPQEISGNERNESDSNKLQQSNDEIAKVLRSDLQNSASFNQLNNLSRTNKKSLDKSQNSSKYFKQMVQKSSASLKNKMSGIEDDLKGSQEVLKNNSKLVQDKEVIHSKGHSSKVNTIDSSDDDDNDDDQMEQNPHTISHKSLSEHVSERKTTTVTEESSLKEDDQVVQRSMRISVHSTKTTSRINSIIEDTSDEDEDDFAGRSASTSSYNKSSHNASSKSISKGSRIKIVALSDDDDDEEDDKAIEHSTSRSTYNKSSTKAVAMPEDDPVPLNNEVPQIDDNIFNYIDSNQPVLESLKSNINLVQSLIPDTGEFGEKIESHDRRTKDASTNNKSINNAKEKIIFVGDEDDDEGDGTDTIQLALSTTSRSSTETRINPTKSDFSSKMILVRVSQNYPTDKSGDESESNIRETNSIRESSKRNSSEVSERSDDERISDPKESGSSRESTIRNSNDEATPSTLSATLSRSRLSKDNISNRLDDEHISDPKESDSSRESIIRNSNRESFSNASTPRISQSRVSRNNISDKSYDESHSTPSKSASVRKSIDQGSKIETASNVSTRNSSRLKTSQVNASYKLDDNQESVGQRGSKRSRSRNKSSRNTSMPKVRLASIIEDHLNSQIEVNSKRQQQGLKQNTTAEETSSRNVNTSKAKSILVEEYRSEFDPKNIDNDSLTNLNILSDVRRNTLLTTSKCRLQSTSDIENPTAEIIKKARPMNLDVETNQEIEPPPVPISLNDDQTTEQLEIWNNENIVSKSARTSKSKILESSARNRKVTKKKTKAQILQDDSEDEEQDEVPMTENIDDTSARISTRKIVESPARNLSIKHKATKENTKKAQIIQDDSEDEEQDEVPMTENINNTSARTSIQKILESPARNLSIKHKATKENTKKAQIIQDDSEDEEQDEVPITENIDDTSARTSITKILESPARNRKATKKNTKTQILQDDSEDEEQDQVSNNEKIDSKSARTSKSKMLESSTRNRKATKENTKKAQILQDDSEEEEQDEVPMTENINNTSARTSNQKILESSTRNRKATKENTKKAQILQDDSEEEEQDEVPMTENINNTSARTSIQKILESSTRNRKATKENTRKAQILQDDSEEEEQDEVPMTENINNTSARTSIQKILESPARNRSTEIPTKNKRKTVRIPEDDTKEEHETLKKSRIMTRNSPRKTDQIHDMSNMNTSNGTSPLMSSTRRSIMLNAGKKRVPKVARHLSTHLESDVPIAESTRISRLPLFETKVISSAEDEAEEDESLETSPRQKISDHQEKKIVDESKKASTTTKGTGHNLPRVTNTILKERSEDNEESAWKSSNLESRQLTIPNSGFSIAKRLLNTTNKGIQTSVSLNKTKEKSQIDVTKTPVKRPKVVNTPSKVSKQKVTGKQRSMKEFMEVSAQEAFRRIFSGTKYWENPALQTIANNASVKELKKEIDKIVGIPETETKKADSSVPPLKKVVTHKKLLPPKPKKAVHSAYLINGKVYRPPPLERPKPWVTNRLYQFLEKCLKPKYDISTRVRSEKFIRHLATVTDLAVKAKKYEDYEDPMEKLIREMARLKIIENRHDFYHFCLNFLPYEIRIKFIPMKHPTMGMTIPYDPKLLFTPLSQS